MGDILDFGVKMDLALPHLPSYGHPALFRVHAGERGCLLVIQGLFVGEVIHGEQLILYRELLFNFQRSRVGQVIAVHVPYGILPLCVFFISIVGLYFSTGLSLCDDFQMKTPEVFDEVVLPRKALFAFSYTPWPGTVNVLWIVLRAIMPTDIRFAAEASLCNPILIHAVGVGTVHAILRAFSRSPVIALEDIFV